MKILRAKGKNQLSRKQVGRPRGSIKIADREEVRDINMPICWTRKDQSQYDSKAADRKKHIRNIGYAAVKKALYEEDNQLNMKISQQQIEEFKAAVEKKCEEMSIEEQYRELNAIMPYRESC